MNKNPEQDKAPKQNDLMRNLSEKVDSIAGQLEKSRITDYVQLLNRPWKLIYLNVISGIAKGVGIAVGFTIFAATLLYLLRWLGALNLPIIGDYIAEIVKIVQAQLEGRSY